MTKLMIWGREFEIKTEYLCDSCEICDNQKNVMSSFIDNVNILDGTLELVKKYCLDKDGDLIGEEIDNIFKYVIPNSIIVSKCEKDNIIALSCKYRFDSENDILIIFNDLSFVAIDKDNAFENYY